MEVRLELRIEPRVELTSLMAWRYILSRLEIRIQSSKAREPDLSKNKFIKMNKKINSAIFFEEEE